MAVIKIVPMPGAVGDKGDEGAPGAQGPQGPAGQNGLPGTPALWSYQGAYNSASAYAVGDVVVYQGQLYYTKSVTTAGTLPTNTAKFDLIASKGADGTNGTNGTNGADGTSFLWSDAFDGGTTYPLNYVVSYQGSSYIKVATGGSFPLPTDSDYWSLLAQKGKDSFFLGTWNSVTEFLAAYQGGPTGLADGDWWAFVKDNTNPNKIYVVREDPISATGWVIDDNEHFVLPQGPQGEPGEQGDPGTGFGIFYLGNYNPSSGYVPNIAVVRGSDGQLYLAKASGQLGDPVGNTAEWEVWIPKGQDGAPGATPFTLVGEYNNGASYNLGVAVYYNGGTYVRTGNPLNPGYPPTLGAVNESWTPIAEKGEPGTDVFAEDGTLYGPTNFGGLKVLGLLNSGDNDLALEANDADIYLQASSGAVTIAAPEVTITSNAVPSSVNINTYNGAIISSARTSGYSDADKVVATLGDLPNITSGTWDTNIKAQSGISGGYSIGLNSPSMGTYTKIGNVVNFYLTYNLSDEFMGQLYPVSYNSSLDSQFSFKLPFPIEQSIHGVASFNGYDYAMNNYVFTGRFFGRVDSSLPAGEFNQPDEEGWTEVHGIGFTHEDPNNRQSYVILSSQDFEDINTNSKRWKNMSHQWPFDFSGTTGHRYFQLQISGTYISA